MQVVSSLALPFKTFRLILLYFFFFNDTATTEIYTLSLHDALPICLDSSLVGAMVHFLGPPGPQSFSISFAERELSERTDRKSTRLNSSHGYISYAVFCLKKKNDRKPIAVSAIPLDPTAIDTLGCRA